MTAEGMTIGLYVASIEMHAPQEEPKLPEPAFYKQLAETARRKKIDLYVFSPCEFNVDNGQLQGYRFLNERWEKGICKLPDIIYDRRFCKNTEEQLACRSALQAIAARKPHIILNGSLPSKLDVYEALANDERIQPLLPATQRYSHGAMLRSRLSAPGSGLFLKPASGMQGKGALLLQRHAADYWSVSGRSKSNLSFQKRLCSQDALEQWLAKFIGTASYIIQPYLQLQLKTGEPFDIRALVQKDALGLWQVTGLAARCGQTGSITSNLHGGGGVRSAKELLIAEYSEAVNDHLLKQIHEISLYAAVQLEQRFGRLAELGLDFGIEQGRRLWLLEANSRPGRSAFRRLGLEGCAAQSLERPLGYAQMLAHRLHTPLITPSPVLDRSRYDNVQEVLP
ncbi:YheC/YheD family protein [Paenibacillus sp. FSL H8-0537]|uniref:YheC/YheD family endospore coat-associated protein n=1 Tax=Paenibacillus sp. FSL H8-0537 TaxID=2921399 RepID=UPI0031016F93